MATVEMLRKLLNERLTAVIEEICGVFTKTIAEYEAKVQVSKEETEQQRQLLMAALDNGVQPHYKGIQQVLVVNEELQDATFSPKQNELELLDIKKEEQEPWRIHDNPKEPDCKQVMCTKQAPPEQDKLRHTLEHADLSPLHINIKETSWNSPVEELDGAEENRETECPGSSSTQQIKTDEEDYDRAALISDNAKTSNSSECETEDSEDEWNRMPVQQSKLKPMKNVHVPKQEPARKLFSNSDLKLDSETQPDIEYKISDSSETEDSDDDWKYSRNPQSRLSAVKPKEGPESFSKSFCETDKTPFNCSVCGKRFRLQKQLRKHTETHSKKKTLTASEDRRHFSCTAEHMRSHLASSITKNCKDSRSLKRKEKPLKEKSFPCSVCDKIFRTKGYLNSHMKMHKTKEK